MEIYNTDISCGACNLIALMHHKDNTERLLGQALYDYIHHEYDTNECPAFILFSDVTRYRKDSYDIPDKDYLGGEAVAKFITKARLGTVTRSTPAVNPNTGNRITVYVWRVSRKAALAWSKGFKATVEEWT